MALNFSKTKNEDRRYSTLRGDLDTRKVGGVNPAHVKNIEQFFKDDDAIIAASDKYPVIVTVDGVIVVGRHFARLLANTLKSVEDPDPKIPVVVLTQIKFDDLVDKNGAPKGEDYCDLLAFAMEADVVKTPQDGLKDDDLLVDIQPFVAAGLTVDQIHKKLPSLKKWKLVDLVRKGKSALRNRAIFAARQEALVRVNAGLPVDYQKLCVKYGLDPKKDAKIVCNPKSTGPVTRNTAALNAIKTKQLTTMSRSKKLADMNREWYESSHAGTPRRMDGQERGTIMTADLYRKVLQLKIEEAMENLRFWQDAQQRGHALIARLEAPVTNGFSQQADRLRRNAGLPDDSDGLVQ